MRFAWRFAPACSALIFAAAMSSSCALGIGAADAKAVEIGRGAQAAMARLSSVTIESFSECHEVQRIELPGRMQLDRECRKPATGECPLWALDIVVINEDQWVGTGGSYEPLEKFSNGACTESGRIRAPRQMPDLPPLAMHADDLRGWEAAARLTGTVDCVTGSCHRLFAEGRARANYPGNYPWRAETLIDTATLHYVSQRLDFGSSLDGSFDDPVRVIHWVFSEWGTPPRIVPPR